MNKRKLQKLVDAIKNESETLKTKTNEELDERIEKIKRQYQISSYEKSLVNWFAATQEVSYRTIGLRHFDTQLLAGILLNEGNVVEMKTGEGKTLVSTLPVALNALEKKGVHVVTVNDYLAERDQKWMGKIYNKLGLSVGLVKSNSTLEEKQESYNSDITYITNSELVFDYLRDNTCYQIEELVQRELNYCLIDEIDSILIDEARTPLILSEPSKIQNKWKLQLSNQIAKKFKLGTHFEIEQKRKEVNLTEKGYLEAKEILKKQTLHDPEDPWMLEILNAIKANQLFKKEKEYSVVNNKIVIIDELSGRFMEDRRWSLGLHEAVEVKEGIPLKDATKTKTSITYQNFFMLYPKLAGMTGTAKTNEEEFRKIYDLEVIQVPTAKPLIRNDLPDFVYQKELGKWKQVINETKKCYQTGQPILIGTSTIEKSEFLSGLLTASNIPHQLLNAKPENVARESEIVAQAGKLHTVTIATNMAGRGTDIILGGNPTFLVKEKLHALLLGDDKNQKITIEILKLINNVWKEYTETNNETEKIKEEIEQQIKNLPYSLDNCKSSLQILYEKTLENVKKDWEIENNQVKNLGGLFVLGTERHETRRIDNQLRGRAGRQGDPGKSQFFISLEDDLIKIFGGNSMGRFISYLMPDPDIPLESNFLTKSLEKAQFKVESYNYEIRKTVFEYDEILNKHRKNIFTLRNKILRGEKYEELFLRLCEMANSDKKRNVEELNGPYSNLNIIEEYWKNEEKLNISRTTQGNLNENWIGYDLKHAKLNAYDKGSLRKTTLREILSTIDQLWTEHIERMEYIRETINWKAYGQQKPLNEYNAQAIESYGYVLQDMQTSMLYSYIGKKIS